MRLLAAWLSDLRVAIVLLLLIALASAVGTGIPQGDPPASYLEAYGESPWLGLLNGEQVLQLQLDHVYSSGWFLALLAWLGLALILCSWRRQWPALQAARRWIDYRTPRQLSKLAIAESRACPDPAAALERLRVVLKARGWQLQPGDQRLAARKGVAGRVGPLLVHTGMVLLMLGAVWGALAGNRLERFLAPERSLDLLARNGDNQLTITLQNFEVERDAAGRPEQFRSDLLLEGPSERLEREISVNHPLRHRGITIYQADWSLAAINLQIGGSPVLQLPLQTFPQLGDQVWGIVLPTRPDGTAPVLLSLESEQGPVQVFGEDGERIALLRPGGPAEEVRGLPLRVASVLPASGLLLKRDPGVPLVYLGFAVTLLGGGLSLVATRQLWAIAADGQLHVGGLCNRNLAAFAQELPGLLALAGDTAPE
ncbi:cytochrome c biogenesis protein [Synechococcus sp. A15-127]|uniref:cytochrome c biogenesis protein ResB n=1 Tax=Synechococcus sp. A15-127 TaxID=1050624 RepID=UPI001648ACF7|nr:cytochrome c biogenesis protein ResB [Synechococcus sp. A15-127]QNI95391.1 cytochrome c biogenesis protein [Synechococcus sp. A15-127]